MITTLIFSIVVFSWIYQIVCTFMGTRELKRTTFGRDVAMPPISILKPVCGEEPELEANLEAFFQQDYPHFEILVCSQNADDPAFSVVRTLQARYPKVSCRIVPGGKELGTNPKINTVGRAFDLANHDWLLISDANVRPNARFLLELAHGITDGSDMQSGVLRGIKAKNQPGRVEAVLYELPFAKAMWLFDALGSPCTSAKCLFFRRSDAKALGGLSAIADYHADDVRLGRLMTKHGKRVSLIETPLPVYIGAPEWKSVWGRQIRWAKNRRVLFAAGFILEPFQAAFVSGALLVWGVSRATTFDPTLALGLHLGIWAGMDLMLLSRHGVTVGLTTLVDWFLVETFRMMVWLASATGRQVNWRGKLYELAPGGKMIPQKATNL